MLVRRTSPDGVAYYVSPLLERAGVPHAFSTRLGGVSPPPFDSLNLGISASAAGPRDDPDRVAQNYARLLAAIGCQGRSRCSLHQVHGPDVVRVSRDTDFAAGQWADALVTDDATKLLSIATADCVPILIASTDGRTVAAAHAGWRGVVAGVVPNTIRTIGKQDLIAAIGPCIGFDAFEVGGEVLDAFASRFGAQFLASHARRHADGKGQVDLRAAVRLQLIASGIKPDRIDMTDRCTFAHADEFFSHRRDRGITGRMASIIGPRVAAKLED